MILPHFQRKMLAEIMAGYQCRDLVLADEQAEIPISGGTVKLYLDDSELNRDSAILIKADGQAFLNLNDCRITDALPVIRRAEGAMDVLAMQFSGANWHPVCYDYPAARYAAISRKKVLAKFNSVARAVRTISPGPESGRNGRRLHVRHLQRPLPVRLHRRARTLGPLRERDGKYGRQRPFGRRRRCLDAR